MEITKIMLGELASNCYVQPVENVLSWILAEMHRCCFAGWECWDWNRRRFC